jgi:serine/threonine-protein kinase
VFTTDTLATALADRYTIERLIGEGGMARVFLARDLRHNRRVALKVLRPDLGAVVGVERFQAEIEVTANLQHPNLLPLFDSGEAGDLLFYVMPYVEGESLRARIDREKQLPVDEAVRLASAVGGALDYAHRHGVIHRDLKPENILLHDGQPLVADFGIALAISNASGARITQTGISLGTPQYMSPEQATGDRLIDGRTDIYSLGALTYEMLTGEPPHVGSTSQAIIARVLTERPRGIRATRPSVPLYVEAAVEKALEKMPADRWPTAREFSEALSGVRPVPMVATDSARAGAPVTQASRRVRVREVIAWALATVFAASGIAAGAYLAPHHEPTRVAGRFPIELPDSVAVTATASPYTHVDISHDGRRLAVLGLKQGASVPMIYVRSLDDPEFAAVRGSEGALSVSVSYDGEWLAFRIGGRGVFKLPIVGGTAQLVDNNATDAEWDETGDLVIRRSGSLFLAPADGSAPRPLMRDSTLLTDATLLPGGRDVLASRGSGSVSELVLVSTENGHVTDLKMAGFRGRYAEGHVVFGRPNGLVYAAPFSLSKRAFTGPATLLLQGVRASARNPKKIDIAVAGNGTLVYLSGSAADLRSMVIVDRQGVEQPLSREDRLYGEPRVSPDGKRIAVRIGESPDVGDVWVYDVGARSLTPLTTDYKSLRPEWSRDGTRIIMIDHMSTDSTLVKSRPWDSNGGVDTLQRGAGLSKEKWVYTASIGPPHGWSAFRVKPSTVSDIFIAPTDSLQALRSFVATPAVELMPRVSPNGRLLAYSSNKSGHDEVYVRPIPGLGPEVAVSTSGGAEPIWSSDGTSLFYRGPTRMMVATVVEQPALAVTKRDSLFIDRWDRSTIHGGYDVFPDGKWFVMTRPAKTNGKPPALYVVMNWPQLVQKQNGAVSGR